MKHHSLLLSLDLVEFPKPWRFHMGFRMRFFQMQQLLVVTIEGFRAYRAGKLPAGATATAMHFVPVGLFGREHSATLVTSVVVRG